MDNLEVADCSTLLMQVAKNIPRAKFLRFRPVDTAFAEAVLDVKAQLEHTLRGFTVLTIGDVVPVSVLGRTVRLEVTDVKPASKSQVHTSSTSDTTRACLPRAVHFRCVWQAVCVIDTDCEVDIDMPAVAVTPPVPLQLGVPVSITVHQQACFIIDGFPAHHDVVLDLSIAPFAGWYCW
jgi:hypothetical protein